MRKEALGFVQQFEAISLEEMTATADLQRRFDRKYIVRADQFGDVVARLRDSHRALEVDSLRAFDYRSVYFDSPSLTSYRGHIQQRRRRFKCRTREYVDSGIRTLEVKLKGTRGITIKKRMALGPETDAELTSEGSAFLRQTVLANYGYEVQSQFTPVVTSEYRRVTLVSRLHEQRVTCDFGLRFAAGGVAYELDEDYVVVETKAAGGACRADHLLRSAHVRPASLSKYVIGVSLTHPDARPADVLRTVRSLFLPAPPARASKSKAAEQTDSRDGQARDALR